MSRLSAHAVRHPAVIALTAVGALLLVLGLEYRPELPFIGGAARGPAVAAVSPSSAAATDPQQISVFDQPRPLPEIIFADGDGRALSVAGFRQRVILLNVWATWCVPCRKEMPTLDRLQAKLGGDDFIVIPLSIDRGGAAAVKRFYQEIGIKKLGIYVDSSSHASHGLGVRGVPTTLLIDREGREVARKLGEAAWDGSARVSLIQQTIDAEPTNARGQTR
jgi:thiol-disulfide isomerase/thioredoxin